jgi:soluble lytic murein transglycosylase-like protein
VINAPLRAENPLERVASERPVQVMPVSPHSLANDTGREISRAAILSSKPTPSPFAPRFDSPPAFVIAPADHVKVSKMVPDATSRSLPQRLGQYDNYIRQASHAFDLNPNLIRAVIAAESSGNARALSSKSAKGVMQLIDSTATAMGVKDVWNPKDNILGGSKYLKQLLDQFDGDVKLAVASYNAGPGAVEKHGGVPPYSETKKYVERVMNYLQLLDQNGVFGNEER